MKLFMGNSWTIARKNGFHLEESFSKENIICAFNNQTSFDRCHHHKRFILLLFGLIVIKLAEIKKTFIEKCGSIKPLIGSLAIAQMKCSTLSRIN